MSFTVLDSMNVGIVRLSAQGLARAVGATKAQILYWGRAEYLERDLDKALDRRVDGLVDLITDHKLDQLLIKWAKNKNEEL